MREWNGQYSTWGNFHTFGTHHCRVTKHIPISAAKNIYMALSSVPATIKNILGISELQINMLETTNYTKLE
jgi:hypothetical protein